MDSSSAIYYKILCNCIYSDATWFFVTKSSSLVSSSSVRTVASFRNIKMKLNRIKKVNKTVKAPCKNSKVKKIKNKGIYTSTYEVGHVDYVRAAYAYIIVPDQPRDILVLQKNLLSALDKDLVKVALLPKKGGRRPEGVVVEILQRNPMPIIGRIIINDNKVQAIIEQRNNSHIVHLEESDHLLLTVHDKVAIALLPSVGNQLIGKVVKHLGAAGLHEVEMHAIMAEFNLDSSFSDEVLQSAAAIPTYITAEEITHRVDLRAIPTFTIDPSDAKDMDDALSYQLLANGYHQVGIHIADVSHYVLPGTVLDSEAYKRNTSVYLVDRCIPMLPEVLSNQLCSLRPNEDKLSFSVLFELDDEGNIHNTWFGEATVRSKRKFTYEEAQAILDSQRGDFYEELELLNRLAIQLRTIRFKRGAINFETKESLFILDKQGFPLAIIPKIRTDSHKLVEEFMLLANKAVATHVATVKKEKKVALPFIYRTHDRPDPDKLYAFFLFVQQLGYKIDVGNKPIYKIMHCLEEEIAGKQEENIIQAMAIRAMAKALYTTKPKPHFALAFTHYSHFTSPIRRYADLLAHRFLKKHLRGEVIDDYDNEIYEKKCQYAVEREYVASSAERASIKYKQVEYMQNLKDSIWEGVISGITEWNIYVEITNNGCEGMIRLSDLVDDEYIFEEQHFRVVGKCFQKSYRLGEMVKVKVKSCDLNRRQIYFLLPFHS